MPVFCTTWGGHLPCNHEGSMKKALSLGLPLLSLLVIGIAACDDTPSNPGTPSADGGFSLDLDGGGGGGGDTGTDPPVTSKCPEPTGAPVVHGTDIYAD